MHMNILWYEYTLCAYPEVVKLLHMYLMQTSYIPSIWQYSIYLYICYNLSAP